MDSFRTSDDTLAALAAHPGLATDGLPLDFLQNREPKLRSDDLTPVSWPADPTLEWCPPGHGDIYTALDASGLLRSLLDQGYKYLFVSNADNLGARPDPALAAWFAASGSPFAAEFCRRTAADRKGGHLARRSSDGQLVLRESAQTRPEDEDAFGDINRHKFFNTNNLWLDLVALDAVLQANDGVLGLPIIRNVKTVDPGRSGQPRGDPDRDRDGCGDRGVRGRRRDRGRPLAVPAGQGHQRPAGAALGCLRADRRRPGPAGADAFRGAAGRPGQALQAGQRLRRPVPGRARRRWSTASS